MRRALSSAFLLLALAGCVGPPSTPPRIPDPPSTSSPAQAFGLFTDALRADDKPRFYSLLSRDTQWRYELWEFETMFDKTRFGKLFRHLMLEWKVAGYEIQADRRTAVVTLVHPTEAGYSKRFEMVLEGRDWRVRLTIAQALEMPEFDERFLYPEVFTPPEEEGAPPPAPRAGSTSPPERATPPAPARGRRGDRR